MSALTHLSPPIHQRLVVLEEQDLDLEHCHHRDNPSHHHFLDHRLEDKSHLLSFPTKLHKVRTATHPCYSHPVQPVRKHNIPHVVDLVATVDQHKDTCLLHPRLHSNEDPLTSKHPWKKIHLQHLHHNLGRVFRPCSNWIRLSRKVMMRNHPNMRPPVFKVILPTQHTWLLQQVQVIVFVNTLLTVHPNQYYQHVLFPLLHRHQGSCLIHRHHVLPHRQGISLHHPSHLWKKMNRRIVRIVRIIL